MSLWLSFSIKTTHVFHSCKTPRAEVFKDSFSRAIHELELAELHKEKRPRSFAQWNILFVQFIPLFNVFFLSFPLWALVLFSVLVICLFGCCFIPVSVPRTGKWESAIAFKSGATTTFSFPSSALLINM